MRKTISGTAIALCLVGIAAPAGAATQTATGVVTQLFAGSNPIGTVAFSISNPPTTTGCPNNAFFTFTQNDIADLPSRNNMYSLLLIASASGATVTVSFNTGVCDANGYPIPTLIGANP